MSVNPKVTVFMPVYNGEKYLNEAIDSILNQTFNDFELLIINDGSTDKSAEIIKSYNDPRIRFVENEENLKLAKTRNKGLELALGEYFVPMDCDDISHPERIQKLVEFMEKNPRAGKTRAQWGWRKDKSFVANLESMKAFEDEYKAGKDSQSKIVGIGGSMCRVKALKDAGGFDEKISGAGEDIDIAIRLRKTGCQFLRSGKITLS